MCLIIGVEWGGGYDSGNVCMGMSDHRGGMGRGLEEVSVIEKGKGSGNGT